MNNILKKIYLGFKKTIRQIGLVILILTILVPFSPPYKNAKAETGYLVPHVISLGAQSVASGAYFPLAHTTSDGGATTEANVQFYTEVAGTWSGLSAYVRQANASGDSTITIRKNGSDTDVSIDISQSATGFFQNTTDSVHVDVGDLMSVSVTTSAGSIAELNSITALFESDSGDTIQYLATNAGNEAGVGATLTPRYYRPSGNMQVNITNEAHAQNIAHHAGEIIGLGVYISANTRTGTTTIRSRVEGATGISFTVATTVTGLQRYSSGSTTAFAAGEKLSYEIVMGGSGTVTMHTLQMTLKSDNEREVTLMGGTDMTRSATTTDIYHFSGGKMTAGAVNTTREYLTIGGVLSDMSLYQSATTASQNATVVLRVNGSSVNETLTVSTNGWYTDSSNTDTIDSDDYLEVLSNRVASGTGSSTWRNNSILFTMDEVLPTFEQSAYRFFANDNSTDVGSALAAQDSSATLTTAGEDFRLRMLLHVDTNRLDISGQNFKLQYVGKGSGTCASPSGGTPASYTDVTDSTLIAYNDNASPADGATLTSNASDPTHSGHTIVNQDYEELNNFTNSEALILSGQDGKWDFSLIDNGAASGATYCLRAVESDGTALGTYSVYPEITMATSGSLSVDIVDSGGTTVGSPSVTMSPASVSFAHQTVTGTFGISSQKIRVDNSTGTATWTLSLAADDGTTAFWDGTPDYDFNDPTANAGDGGDADSLGGQMSIDPSGETITPEGGCTTTNISAGSSSAFNQGVTDSITLASAASGADTNCYWDITDIDISQTIPAEQPVGSYSIDMTLSIIAS